MLALLLIPALLLLSGCSRESEPKRLQARLTGENSPWARVFLPEHQGALARFRSAPVYVTEAEYDPDGHYYRGWHYVRFTNPTDRPLEQVRLRSLARPWGPVSPDENLRVEEFLVNGKPAEYTAGETLLTVLLPKPLAPGRAVDLAMKAQIRLPEIRPDLIGMITTPDPLANPGLIGASEAVTALGGFPVVLLDGGSDAAWDTLEQGLSQWFMDEPAPALCLTRLTLPEQWEVFGAGATVREHTARPGWKRFEVAAAGNGCQLFAARGMQRGSVAAGPVTVNSYFAPEDQAEGLKVMDEVANLMRAGSEALGAPAVAEIDLVRLPTRLAGVYLGGGAMALAPVLYRDTTRGSLAWPDLDPALAPLLESNYSNLRHDQLAQMVARIWWTEELRVAPGPESAGWIAGGLQGATVLYLLERGYGLEEGQRYLARRRLDYMVLRARGFPDAPVGLAADQYEHRAHRATLERVKGPLFFDQLRQAVGDEAFFAPLREAKAAHRFTTVAPNELLDPLMGDSQIGGVAAALKRRWIEESHGDEDIGLLRPSASLTRYLSTLPPLQ